MVAGRGRTHLDTGGHITSAPLPGGRWLWRSWALTRLAMVCLAATTFFPGVLAYTASVAQDVIAVYAPAQDRLVSGSLPYRDFAFEYPPGSLPFLLLPGFSLPPDLFLLVWLTQMLLLDALVLAMLRRLAAPACSALAPWLWVGGGAALGALVLTRNDLVVVAPVVGALLALQRHRPALAGLLLAYAGLAKLWPWLLIPLALLVLREGRLRLLAAASALLAAAFALLALTGTLLPMLSQLRAYHGARPVELEALIATPEILGGLLTGSPERFERSFGSFNLVSAHTELLRNLTSLGSVLVLALVLLTTGWVARPRELGYPARLRLLAQASLMLITGLLCTSKVLSPQYGLWLLGLAAILLALDPHPRWIAWWLGGVLLATQLIYPWAFNDILVGSPLAWLVVVRNLLLLGGGCVLALVLIRHYSPAAGLHSSRGEDG